jgi:hypothetical protein
MGHSRDKDLITTNTIEKRERITRENIPTLASPAGRPPFRRFGNCGDCMIQLEHKTLRCHFAALPGTTLRAQPVLAQS